MRCFALSCNTVQRMNGASEGPTAPAQPNPPVPLAERRIAILGAGIGGLAAAAALIRRGARDLTVFEQEPIPFTGASGRNAAIFRPLETDEEITALARESLPLLAALQESAMNPLLVKSGLLMLDSQEVNLKRMGSNAEAQGFHSELTEDARKYCPGVELNHQGPALFSADGGVLDPHEIGLALMRYLHQHRVKFRFKTKVTRLVVEPLECAPHAERATDGTAPGRLHQGMPHSTCTALELEGGELVSVDDVVLAAGAQSGRLADAAGSPVPLIPLQRHLGVLETDDEYPSNTPVIWQQDPELYFRPELRGVLVSPCDEKPQLLGVPQADVTAFEPVSARLGATCPPLASAKIRSHWACIRTKSLDGRPVIGPDPHVLGLHWLSGLAGFGMTCGLAAGEHLAAHLARNAPHAVFSPRRFLLPA